MRQIFKLTAALAVAAAIGLVSAWYAVNLGYGAAQARSGPWVAPIGVGNRNADPYTRAALARSGEVPLAASEAITFRATTDDSGRSLSGTCSYRLEGRELDANWWTLAVTGPQGELLDTPAKRYGLTSLSVLRDGDGSFTVMLAPTARAGNWVPTAGARRVALRLTLYDTEMLTNGGLQQPGLPTIMRVACP